MGLELLGGRKFGFLLWHLRSAGKIYACVGQRHLNRTCFNPLSVKLTNYHFLGVLSLISFLITVILSADKTIRNDYSRDERVNAML